MSLFVTRPLPPLPAMFRTSMWCSRAIFLTTGDKRNSRASAADHGLPKGGAVGAGGATGLSAVAVGGAVVAPGRSGASGACRGVLSAVAAVAAEGGAAGGAVSTAGAEAAFGAPLSSITPTTVLIGTVSPSLTLISLTTPAIGDGISASTLSVEISNKGSSRSTGSPTFFSHRTMVPSATDSPICGMTTDFGMLPHQM